MTFFVLTSGLLRINLANSEVDPAMYQCRAEQDSSSYRIKNEQKQITQHAVVSKKDFIE